MISQWFPNPNEKRAFQVLAAWEGNLESTVSYPLQPLHPLQYPRQGPLQFVHQGHLWSWSLHHWRSAPLWPSGPKPVSTSSQCVCPATREHFSSLWTDRVVENGFICLLLYFIFAMKLDIEDFYGNQNLPTIFHQKWLLGCCAPVKGNRGRSLRYIFCQLCDAESTLRTEEIPSFPVVTHLYILIVKLHNKS